MIPIKIKLKSSLEQAFRDIALSVNANKTEFILKQNGMISTLNAKRLELVKQFAYHGSDILSTKNDVNQQIGKMRTTFDRLLIKWKFDTSDKINLDFFQPVHVGTTV